MCSYTISCRLCWPSKLQYENSVEHTILLPASIDQSCQLHPTGGPHNSLRTRLWAAHVHTYVEMGGEMGLNSPERRYLQTIIYD